VFAHSVHRGPTNETFGPGLTRIQAAVTQNTDLPPPVLHYAIQLPRADIRLEPLIFDREVLGPMIERQILSGSSSGHASANTAALLENRNRHVAVCQGARADQP
jgi:hypothetical protein